MGFPHPKVFCIGSRVKRPAFCAIFIVLCTLRHCSRANIPSLRRYHELACSYRRRSSNKITKSSPSLPKYTRQPGPKSILTSLTPSPTACQRQGGVKQQIDGFRSAISRLGSSRFAGYNELLRVEISTLEEESCNGLGYGGFLRLRFACAS